MEGELQHPLLRGAVWMKQGDRGSSRVLAGEAPGKSSSYWSQQGAPCCLFQVNRPRGSPVQNGQKYSGRGLLETHTAQRPLASQSTQQPGDHSPWEEEKEVRLGAGEPSDLGGDTP